MSSFNLKKKLNYRAKLKDSNQSFYLHLSYITNLIALFLYFSSKIMKNN